MSLINSICICKKKLATDNVIMFSPCNHMAHKKCHKKEKNKEMCPFCGAAIDHYIELENLGEDSQRYIDIMSTRMNSDHKVLKHKIIKNIPHILSVIFSIRTSSGTLTDQEHIIDKILNMCNVKINCYGDDKIIHEYKTFVATHTSPLDMAIIYKLFKPKFVATAEILHTPLGKKLGEIFDPIIVHRGRSNNTVKKMNEKIGQCKSICIFPEGMISNYRTIVKFRSGGFSTNYPIYALVLKYNDNNIDPKLTKCIGKLMSHINKIDVFILGPYYGPLGQDDIEAVRKDMANMGDMHLSRVTNKFVSD